MTKPKLSRAQVFVRIIAANSATVTLLVLLILAAGLVVTGVFILAGTGWALIAGSAACLLAASFLRIGMVRK